MATIELAKSRLSQRVSRLLHDYYGSVEGATAGYVDERWRRWAATRSLRTYAAKRDGVAFAWIVYDAASSLIEEILSEGRDDALLASAIDGLIAAESLVAAEVPESDGKRYDFLVGYGFRPTRSYSSGAVRLVRMELSTAVYLEKARSGKPARPYGRKERVAIERVGSDGQAAVNEALLRLVDGFGGVRRFLRPGGTVVIKPNVVADHGMKDGVYQGGVVTDIRVVRGLIELFLPVAGAVVVAEGSSINRSETTRMFAHYGYDGLAGLDPKVRLVDLNKDELVEKKVPFGKRMAARKVPVTVERADLVVSVPVMKVHFAAAVSLAVKNLQGVMPPIEKYMSHFFGLWQNLVNIHRLVKPALTIIDGITGQEDFGPVSGTAKPMGILIGATNPVAADAVAMRVMGLDPASSPPVLLACIQGLGPIEEGSIEVVGTPVRQVASSFRQPVIDVSGGRDLAVHDGGACPGCRGYLHFVLAKLRKADPADALRRLIDRPLDPPVHIFLGPGTEAPVGKGARNIFMGMCQQHHAAEGTHLPGCPPHAEVIMNGVFRLFPDVARPKYADETEEAKLERMLKEVLRLEAR